MGRQGYVGNSADVQRIRRKEKEREEERRKFEEAKNRVESGARADAFKQFGAAGSSETLEQAFRNETVGLVSRADFAEKRANLQEKYEEEERERKRAAEEKALDERRRKRSQLRAKASKLSFVGGDEDEDEDGYAFDLFPTAKASAKASAKKFANYGKNPDAETKFLPDVDRELEERKRREELKAEFLKQEEEAKAQSLKITYSYWDGGGHRREVTTKQGETIGAFLRLALDQLAPEFRQVRSSSAEDLMYIKEDLILPHHLTFHELIMNKARGKSGPLFDFGVTEDVRLKADARVEKTDSHAGKVVERHWYEKNKHIFPANRWEIYDPKKTFDKYTIH